MFAFTLIVAANATGGSTQCAGPNSTGSVAATCAEKCLSFKGTIPTETAASNYEAFEVAPGTTTGPVGYCAKEPTIAQSQHCDAMADPTNTDISTMTKICNAGLYCKGAMNTTDGTCDTLPALGQPCATGATADAADGMCASETTCTLVSGDKKCTNKTCTTDAECGGGDKKCLSIIGAINAGKNYNWNAVAPTASTPGYCFTPSTDTTCSALLTDMAVADLTTITPCKESGKYCAFTNGGTGACTALPTEGHKCAQIHPADNNKALCASGLICSSTSHNCEKPPTYAPQPSNNSSSPAPATTTNSSVALLIGGVATSLLAFL